MDIGKLNQFIEAWKPVSIADGQGGRTTEYVKDFEAWAELLRPRFSTANIQGGIATDVTQGIRIRSGVRILQGWHIHMGGRIFKVIHPMDETIAGEIILTCREVVRKQ